jgi:hypothetical protein
MKRYKQSMDELIWCDVVTIETWQNHAVQRRVSMIDNPTRTHSIYLVILMRKRRQTEEANDTKVI